MLPRLVTQQPYTRRLLVSSRGSGRGFSSSADRREGGEVRGMLELMEQETENARLAANAAANLLLLLLSINLDRACCVDH